MFTFLALLLVASLGAEPAFSFKLLLPRATAGLLHHCSNLKRAADPEPTEGPVLFRSAAEHVKHRRQQSLLVDTCGYLDGNAGDPITCDPGNACATNTDANHWGCCQTDASGNFVSSECAFIATPYTGCYPYSEATLCTGACYTFNRVCDFSVPYCGAAYLTDGISTYTEYICLTEASITTFNLLATPTTSAASVSLISGSHFPTSSSTLTSTSTPVSQPSPPTSSPNPSSNHTGAIVGGVVGGLIAIAAVVGGAIFFLRRKKKAERKSVIHEVSQMYLRKAWYRGDGLNDGDL